MLKAVNQFQCLYEESGDGDKLGSYQQPSRFSESLRIKEALLKVA